jgi:hypothetical protein
MDCTDKFITPRNRIPGVTREQYAKHMRDVIMAVFGLGHTLNTKVGMILFAAFLEENGSVLVLQKRKCFNELRLQGLFNR